MLVRYEDQPLSALEAWNRIWRPVPSNGADPVDLGHLGRVSISVRIRTNPPSDPNLDYADSGLMTVATYLKGRLSPIDSIISPAALASALELSDTIGHNFTNLNHLEQTSGTFRPCEVSQSASDVLSHVSSLTLAHVLVVAPYQQ